MEVLYWTKFCKKWIFMAVPLILWLLTVIMSLLCLTAGNSTDFHVKHNPEKQRLHIASSSWRSEDTGEYFL